MHFARVLRAAGMPVGVDRVQLALRALAVAGLERREDFHSALSACFVDRLEQIALFDQAFQVFWREPDLLGRIMAMLPPRLEGSDGFDAPPPNQRLAAAMLVGQAVPSLPLGEGAIELEAELGWSDFEALRSTDFGTMTNEEWDAARRIVSQMHLLQKPEPTRRMVASRTAGRIDWQRTMKASARGASLFPPRYKHPRMRPSPLVIVADISGSMSKYSRMLLHFAHALMRGEARVEAFVFGTRLTPITRALKARDPDVALASVTRIVKDWSGGTRICASLTEFNRLWSRRVLAQNATVLLITDGLEHGDTAQLGFEMERLAKSCRRLVWLNPLLRFDGFEPRAAGIRAMLPWADDFVSAHNIESLQHLAAVLVAPGLRRTH